MKAVLNGKEMKEFDARSIKGYGIPSLVLMERAAMAVAEKACLLYTSPSPRDTR